MKIVIRGRAGGKTFESVQWVKEDPDRVLIVANHEMVKHAMRLGLDRHQVMTLGQTDMRLRGRRAELCIDNADLIFPTGEVPVHLEMQPVCMITINGGPNYG